MFVSADTETSIQLVLNRPVVLIHRSLNGGPVAKPSGQVAERAYAYLIELEEPDDTIRLLVCFYMVAERELHFYQHDQHETVSIAEVDVVEAEATDFLQSMGFVMDDVCFQNLPLERQVRVQKVLPFFFETSDIFVRRVSAGYDESIEEEFARFVNDVREAAGVRPMGEHNQRLRAAREALNLLSMC